VTEDAGIEASLVRLDAELVKIMSNMSQVNKPEETSIDNLRAIVLDGTGRVDGELVKYGVAIIETPSNQLLLAICIVQFAISLRLDPVVTKIIESITPTSRGNRQRIANQSWRNFFQNHLRPEMFIRRRLAPEILVLVLTDNALRSI
jgi:hypothetical protein